MKTKNPYLHNPMPSIARSLEEGPDYQPDWRSRVAQQYLRNIVRAEPDCRADQLTKVLAKEPDEHIIELLLFHLNGPGLYGESVDYALRCLKSNAKTQIAS